MSERMRNTKILATLGPATDAPGVLAGILKAGVNVVRLNFSHGDPSEQIRRAEAVRAAAAECGVEVGILADLPGPKIRIERFKEGKINLKTGDQFVLIADENAPEGDQTHVGVSYLGLPHDVAPGDVLLLDDGLMQLQVTSVEGKKIHTTVLNDGVLSNRKGLNKQGGGLSLGALTDHDRKLIAIAAKIDVDFIAVSFCRNAQDMNEARDIARKHGSKALVVSKIERTEAIENLTEIVSASDVVMVARGDLGVEVGDAELPGLQKKIIKESLSQGKVVITATQMLQSMTESPLPTRAEILDVANAVIDGTDAVMLSAESAAGAYPVKAVEAMARICLKAEQQFEQHIAFKRAKNKPTRTDQAIAMAAMFLSDHIKLDAVIALTESGTTARFISRYHSQIPIYAFAFEPGVRRQMAMMRGVFPTSFESRAVASQQTVHAAINVLITKQCLKKHDCVVYTCGEPQTPGTTNTLHLLEVGEDGAVTAFPSR